MKIKPPADVTDFERKNCASTIKIQTQLRRGVIDLHFFVHFW